MLGAIWQEQPMEVELPKEEQELMEIGKLNGRTLYVGGAEGVDRLAEDLGKERDMNVEVILNPRHPRARFITPLSEQQMKEAIPYVLKANETLQRNITMETLYDGYLQRNYWIVKRAVTVFAFGKFERRIYKTTLEGGTGCTNGN